MATLFHFSSVLEQFHVIYQLDFKSFQLDWIITSSHRTSAWPISIIHIVIPSSFSMTESFCLRYCYLEQSVWMVETTIDHPITQADHRLIWPDDWSELGQLFERTDMLPARLQTISGDRARHDRIAVFDDREWISINSPSYNNAHRLTPQSDNYFN